MGPPGQTVRAHRGLGLSTRWLLLKAPPWPSAPPNSTRHPLMPTSGCLLEVECLSHFHVDRHDGWRGSYRPRFLSAPRQNHVLWEERGTSSAPVTADSLSRLQVIVMASLELFGEVLLRRGWLWLRSLVCTEVGRRGEELLLRGWRPAVLLDGPRRANGPTSPSVDLVIAFMGICFGRKVFGSVQLTADHGWRVAEVEP